MSKNLLYINSLAGFLSSFFVRQNILDSLSTQILVSILESIGDWWKARGCIESRITRGMQLINDTSFVTETKPMDGIADKSCWRRRDAQMRKLHRQWVLTKLRCAAAVGGGGGGGSLKEAQRRTTDPYRTNVPEA